jgi:hypothetical protein
MTAKPIRTSTDVVYRRMDRVPAKLPNTSSRLIAMAASLIGDAESVRKEMGCSLADFAEYCTGRKEPSWPEFDRLIELVVREQSRLIARNRAFLAKTRARSTPNKKGA